MIWMIEGEKNNTVYKLYIIPCTLYIDQLYTHEHPTFSDSDVDECTDNPCKNGGTCTNEPWLYSCACAYGYKGKNCEERK